MSEPTIRIMCKSDQALAFLYGYYRYWAGNYAHVSFYPNLIRQIKGYAKIYGSR